MTRPHPWAQLLGRSIRAKITFAAVISSIAALSLVIIGVTLFDTGRARQDQLEQLQSLIAFTRHHIVASYHFDKPSDAEVTLAQLSTFPDIQRAWVLDDEGAIFASWEKSGVTHAALPGLSEDGIHQLNDRIVLRQTFHTGLGRSASLYVESDLGRFYQLQDLYLRLALLALAVGTLSAALVLAPLRHWVAGPLSNLAALARRVSLSRDYDIELPAAGADEVGDLVQAFDEMLREIRRRETELRRAMELAERAAAEASRQANEAELANIQLRAENAERLRLEEQLLQAQKMESIGQLAGGIAHDFNNLLTVILGWTEYASASPQDHERMLEGLGQIRQSAERAANLTRQLLAFARRQVARPRATDLNALIEELGRMLRRVIGEQIELRLELAPGLAKVYVDPGQIEQILLNMALNAKDAMPKGGKLSIRTESCRAKDCLFRATAQHPLRDHVLLEISDTGVGIPEEIHSKIFEPFFTTKHQSKGTGLGLSMCYGIVRQSGGVIDLVSSPGKGASFRIYLPILTDPVGVADTTVSIDVPLSGNEVVLIAEDERSLRLLLENTLRGAGYRVLSAVDGQSALRLAKENGYQIDIVVTDLVMPHLGGQELVQELRTIKPDLPVVFVSGYDARLFDSDTAAALPAGVELLQKPFSPTELMRAIRTAIVQAANLSE